MQTSKLKLTTRLIVDEAISRGLKVEVLDYKKSFYVITDEGGKEYYLRSNSSNKTSAINHWIAKNKSLTYKLAERLNVPVPATETYIDLNSATSFLNLHKEIVIKPADAAHGNGVSTGVFDTHTLEHAISRAKMFSSNIILQQQVVGDDYRLLIIGGKLSAAAIREPAGVVGDGVHSIAQLIEIENSNPERGINYHKKLNIISAKHAHEYLGQRLQEVPSEGQKVRVVGTANMGTGGRAIDVTDTLDANIVQAGLRLAKGLDMGLCAVDFMVDPAVPEKPWLLEINATPSFGLHEFPSEGTPRPVTKNFLDWLLA